MAIAFRSATTNEQNGFAGVVNPVPAGTVDGDLLIWRISSTAGTPPTSVPATGWAEVFPTVTVGAGQVMCWYRIASSEPGSYTEDNTGMTSGRTVGIMAAYSGVDNITPFDVATPTPVTGTTAFGTLGITPVTAGAWVLAIARCQVATAVLGTTLSSTNLDAVDVQISSTSGTASNEIGGLGHYAWPNGSGSFTPNWSASNATARTCVAVAALRAAAAGGGAMSFVKTVTVG